MTSNPQAPKVEQGGAPMGGDRITHPAFGQIEVAHKTSMQGGVELFGSKLHHRNIVTVSVKTAYVGRDLNQDWIYGDKHLIEFSMSEAQWAAFVASHGASPTPVTISLRAEEDASLIRCPAIESPETNRQTYEREVREACESYSQAARVLTEKLAACVADGKAGKGTLEELRKLAATVSEGMPKTVEFIQKQFSESMDKTVQDGKVEMESFVYNLAKQTGIDMMRQQSVELLERTPDNDQN